MKTLFKLLLVLVLCFAVLCERNLGFQVDSLGVAHQNNMAPYIKVLMQNTSYLMNLQSIYEIYQDTTTNQWIKDFTTETKLDTLLWEIRADLLKGYVALLGKACPCANPQPPDDVEPFPISRRMGRSVRAEPFDSCSIPNFGYLRLVFKQHVAENITDCSAATVDLAQCTTQCNQFCANSTNPTTCIAGCAAITSVDNIDTDVCYTACNATGTEDPDCINGCMNIVDCATESTCRLDIGYHLHNYQWVNSTTNAEALRKLVFAFEIVPQPEEGPACGSEVVTWIKGPFLLWINTTSLSLQHTDECVDCPIPGLESAVEVPSNLFFAPGESAVTGRLYVDQFESGLSIFNYPVDVVEVEEQPNPEPPIPEPNPATR